MAKIDYTREELIAICDKAFVPQDKWGNRDSLSAQMGIYRAYGLLKAGCWFEVLSEGDLKTDERTIWLRLKAHNFRWFEYACEDDTPREGYGDDEYGMDLLYYLPTPERLDFVNGNDWY